MTAITASPFSHVYGEAHATAVAVCCCCNAAVCSRQQYRWPHNGGDVKIKKHDTNFKLRPFMIMTNDCDEHDNMWHPLLLSSTASYVLRDAANTFTAASIAKYCLHHSVRHGNDNDNDHGNVCHTTFRLYDKQNIMTITHKNIPTLY